MITFVSDFSAVEREFDRLGSLPDFKTKAALDAVLEKGFKLTQANVHVITGSLKSSGRKDSEVHKIDHVWEGNIRYGGPSKGVNNPVDYAIYEKARDEDHDFMKALPGLHPEYIKAIKTGLGG